MSAPNDPFSGTPDTDGAGIMEAGADVARADLLVPRSTGPQIAAPSASGQIVDAKNICGVQRLDWTWWRLGGS